MAGPHGVFVESIVIAFIMKHAYTALGKHGIAFFHNRLRDHDDVCRRGEVKSGIQPRNATPRNKHIAFDFFCLHSDSLSCCILEHKLKGFLGWILKLERNFHAHLLVSKTIDNLFQRYRSHVLAYGNAMGQNGNAYRCRHCAAPSHAARRPSLR